MQNTIEKIAKSFADDHEEWTTQQKLDKVMKDLEYILLFAKEPKEVFSSFVAWQKELLKSVNIPYSWFESLCQKTLDLCKADLITIQVENISGVVEDEFRGINVDRTTNQSDQIVEFHYKLFNSIDDASTKVNTESFRKDAQYILDYLTLVEKEGDTALFERFVEWQTNLLAVLNIEKLSLIRLLVTIKLFVDEPQKVILDYGIRYLVAAEGLNIGKDMEIQPDEVSEVITSRHIQLFHEIDPFSKELYRDKIKSDADKHLSFLEQALQIDSKVLFTEYINWACSTLSSLGIEPITLIRFLVSMRMVLPQTKLKAGIPYLDESIRSLVSLDSDKKLQMKSYLANPEAREYLSLILEGKRKEATKYILELAEGSMELQDIYINIFQSTQYEIGRLWEKNEVSVAQEHYCTATTQMIMSMLYPRLFSSKSIGKSVVATCVGNELHEIGVRMIADFLELKGWDTYYVGANTPTSAILDAIDKYEADLVAISVTLTPHIKRAMEIIKKIRITHPRVKVLVGGYPFIQDPDLYKKIGADGFVKSAQEVHQKAISLFNE